MTKKLRNKEVQCQPFLSPLDESNQNMQDHTFTDISEKEEKAKKEFHQIILMTSKYKNDRSRQQCTTRPRNVQQS